MKVNIQIKTKDETIETLNLRGDYLETDQAHVISYIESLYDNLIIIDKGTNIITVEKQSTVSNQQYYSKLVFELGNKHKCSIEVDGYNTFVNIKTISMPVIKTEKQLKIALKYELEGSLNDVEVLVEW